jgi:hypothetical protein
MSIVRGLVLSGILLAAATYAVIFVSFYAFPVNRRKK